MFYKNIFNYIIIVFLVCYILVSYLEPNIIFNHDLGILRPFGVGYDNTTILPLWLVSILLAIFSYIFMVYLNHIMYNNVFIQ